MNLSKCNISRDNHNLKEIYNGAVSHHMHLSENYSVER